MTGERPFAEKREVAMRASVVVGLWIAVIAGVALSYLEITTDVDKRARAVGFAGAEDCFFHAPAYLDTMRVRAADASRRYMNGLGSGDELELALLDRIGTAASIREIDRLSTLLDSTRASRDRADNRRSQQAEFYSSRVSELEDLVASTRRAMLMAACTAVIGFSGLLTGLTLLPRRAGDALSRKPDSPAADDAGGVA